MSFSEVIDHELRGFTIRYRAPNGKWLCREYDDGWAKVKRTTSKDCINRRNYTRDAGGAFDMWNARRDKRRKTRRAGLSFRMVFVGRFEEKGGEAVVIRVTEADLWSSLRQDRHCVTQPPERRFG